jgi:hypothetical protein
VRRGQQAQHLLHALDRRGDGRLALPRGHGGDVIADPGLEQIAGQAHVHRAGAAASRQIERGRDVLSEPGRILGPPRRLGDRRGHRGLIHLLEAAPADLRQRRVPAQQHHRRFRHERAVERRDRVAVAGAGGDQRHPRLVGEPAPRIGHVHCRRLVARVQDRQVMTERRVVQRQDLVAGEREDVADAGRRESFDHQVRAGPGHAGHRTRPRATTGHTTSTAPSRTP